MKKILSAVCAGTLIAGAMPSAVLADNPIVQTIYTADVAPMVHDGVVYAYSGHDEDTADGWFDMQEWRCYSSTDMANWTDCGSPLDYTVFDWAGSDAWAAQCIQSKKDGKFYFYAPVMRKDGTRVLGVAVSDSPTGPFTDAIGEPLFEFGIDPTVYIDDDGKVYLYWGGGNELFYVILDEDMITPLCEPVKVDLSAGMNGPEGAEDDFYEAPWLTKRGDTYYMIYSGNIPEGIYYATSDTPIGPWKHQGKIMDNQGWVPFTSHVGVVDYKDNSYIFYHNAGLPGGYGYHRSIAVEEFKYNADGSIPFIPYTKEGPKQIESLDPYTRTEAETIAWEEGIETESFGTRGVDYGVNVYDIDNGDYIKVKGVDFKDGAASFTAGVAAGFTAGNIELHLDSVTGSLIGTLPVSYTGGTDKWKEITTSVSGASGTHDLYLVFKGDETGDLFKFDYWKFTEKTESKNVTALRAEADNYKIDKLDGRNTANIKVMAIYEDGSTEDVTEAAEITSGSDNISLNGTTVTGLEYGNAEVNVSYGGKTDTAAILVKDLDTEVTARSLTAETGEIELICGTSAAYKLIAEFADGHTEDVTDRAAAEYDSSKLEIADGKIKAKTVGEAIAAFSYQGEKGDAVTTQIKVTAVTLNPFDKNEAEAYHEGYDIQSEGCSDDGGGEEIGYIHNGSWIMFGGVDFGDGANLFEARLSSETSGGNIELYLDSMDGEPAGKLSFSGSGGWQNWVSEYCAVNGASGVHNLYIKFTGGEGNLMNMNWWRLSNGEAPKPVQKYKFTISQCSPQFEGTACVYNGNTIGYIDKGTDGAPDGAVTFKVNVDKAGAYKMSAWNAVWNGDGTATHIYKINGGEEFTVEYPPTTWGWRLSELTPEIELNAGENTIRIAADTGAIELEYFELQYIGDESAVTEPYSINEAESYRKQSGVQLEDRADGGQNVAYIENGDWIMFKNVDFGAGAKSFTARLASETAGGNIELYLDDMDGAPVGTLSFNGSGGWQNWTDVSCGVDGISGQHDVYMKFTGGSGYLFNIDKWQFERADDIKPEGIVTEVVKNNKENNRLDYELEIANYTGEAVAAQAIIALYNENGILENIKLNDFSVKDAEKTTVSASFDLPDDADGCYVKAFLWDGVNTMKPLPVK